MCHLPGPKRGSLGTVPRPPPRLAHHGSLHLLVYLVELQRVGHGGWRRHPGFGRGGRLSAASGSVPPPARHAPGQRQVGMGTGTEQLRGKRRVRGAQPGGSPGGRWLPALPQEQAL